jgi:hypothetical protein
MVEVDLKSGSAGSANLLITQTHISSQDFKIKASFPRLISFNSITLFIIRVIRFEN